MFEIFLGGTDEMLAVRFYRDRKRDVYHANDGGARIIESGSLDQIMTALEEYFMRLHGKLPDAPA